jgi:2-keto-4-pentenoate hydratase/2-oxohepta-3-ene-1,7-dioic acid hydratase in catechol pathway
MKLTSFTRGGKTSYGAVIDDGIIDLGRRLKYPTLLSALSANALDEVTKAASGAAADYKLADVKLLTPMPDAPNYFCVGRNYKGHVAEVAGKLPDYPSMFLRMPSSLAACGEPIIRPILSGDFDFEGELALVIGRGGRHIRQKDALSHVAGYSILMDGSIRDYQFNHCLTVGKNFYRTGSFGPWIVTADEIGDPTLLDLHTRLNGTQVQHTRTDDFIFDIPCIIEYVSAFTKLMPGDIIATGTPEGVGFARKPPLWMQAGDTLEVEISKIGILRNTVVDEQQSHHS